MSCLILDPLPAEIIIADQSYEIDTDFRKWIQFGDIVLQSGDDSIRSAVKVIKLCIKSKALPPNVHDTLNALLKFYSNGFILGEQHNGKGGESGKRIYDFVSDAKYFYSAFMSQYRIDLTCEPIHWYKFCALFQGLSENEKISKIMGYRSTKVTEIKDKKQKAFIRKMQEIYWLPDNRSEEEKNKSIVSVLDKMI